MSTVIQIENVAKAYQIGQIGTGTLSQDIGRWYARMLGKEDPYLKIGETVDSGPGNLNSIVWSLRDINASIEAGDVVGIIGKNGAGKSTLLKLLSRVTSPTKGTIRIRGRVASLLEVGTGFHPELTGRENIFLNGAILGMSRAEIRKKFDEIVAFSGVERYIDTPVKRYSSGMYVRLAFAVAAHLQSEILVVDEVLAVGDAEFQKKCLGKMNEVSRVQGRTVLFVSHNMGAILNLCRSAILLNDGTMFAQGRVAEVVDRYNRMNHDEITSSRKLVCSSEEQTGKQVVIHSIELGAETEVPDFFTDNSLFITTTFTCREDARDLVVGLNVLNQYETPLLRLNYNDFDEGRYWKKGYYKVVFEIPPYTFANGNYILDVDIAIPNTERFTSAEMKLHFSMKPRGRLGDVYFVRHNANYNNVIRPKAKFQITYEETTE